MKKLMILAVAAIALVACSKTFDTGKSNGAAIGFNTWNEVLTKSRTQGQAGTSFAAGDHFWVYGFKNTNTPVFQSQEVTTENGTTWTYSPKKFWDATASSYTFFALSRVEATDPTLAANQAASALDGSFGSDDISFDGKTQDILVAEKVVVNKTNADPAWENFNNWHTVDLNFHHIATLVDFKVKKAPALEHSTVAITGFDLLAIKSNGKYSITYDGSNKPVVTWADAATPATTSYDETMSVAGPASLPDDVALHSSSSELINRLIVRPHTLADTELMQISYTITTPVGNGNEVVTVQNAQVKLNLFDDTDYPTDDDNVNDGAQYNASDKITAWEAGKHYTYYLTIDAHTIEFTGSITDWTAVSGYHYLVN